MTPEELESKCSSIAALTAAGFLKIGERLREHHECLLMAVMVAEKQRDQIAALENRVRALESANGNPLK